MTPDLIASKRQLDVYGFKGIVINWWPVTLTIQQICIRFLSIYEPSLVGCLISLQEHYINDDGDSGEVGGRHLHLFYQ